MTVNVAVIVDDVDPDRRRTSFWEDQFTNLQPQVTCKHVSLLALMNSRTFFNPHDYDVIIFNWCVLDGSVMYQSDRVQDIVAFYDDHFRRFVNNGGVIIVESQPKRWRPEQRAYDILFKGELKVIRSEHQLWSDRVTVRPDVRDHPTLKGFPDQLRTSNKSGRSWFPDNSTSSISLKELHPEKAYAGAFDVWSGAWLPLLYTEDGKHPVMLMKIEGLGMWVATTMFLASGDIEDLVERLVVSLVAQRQLIRDFHAHYDKRRRWHLAGAVGAVVIIAATLTWLLFAVDFTTKLPYGDTVAANVILGLIVSAILAALTLGRRRLFAMFRLGLNR